MAGSAVFAFLCGVAVVAVLHSAPTGATEHLSNPDTSDAFQIGDNLKKRFGHKDEVKAPKIKTINNQATVATYKMTTEIPVDITTPNSVTTNVGTFNFADGMPDEASVKLAYETLDHQRGVETFLNFIPAASIEAMRVGVKTLFPGTPDGESQDQNWAIMAGLLDSKGLFLTGNTDTVYAMAFIDLSPTAPSGAKGAVVIEIPPKCGPSTVNDAYFQFVTDMGGPGPDRGAGGKYLLLGPDYDGDLKSENNGDTATVDGVEYFISHSPSYSNWAIARGFTVEGDVGPPVKTFEDGLKVYPLNKKDSPPAMNWENITGKYFNTIHANTYAFYKEFDDVIQREPSSLWPAETLGQATSIGLQKGKPFDPSDSMKATLTSAVATGNAIARSLSFRPRNEKVWLYGRDSAWFSAFIGGDYRWLVDGGAGGKNMDARAFFFYIATVNTPAMVLEMVGVGSQYALIALDAQKNYLEGSKTYTLNVPKDVPAKDFWSVVVYDPQTRSELQTDQQFPSVNSKRKLADGKTPATTPNADGSTTLYFGPTAPTDASKKGNWVQTISGKNWFAVFRLYGPLKPYFDKTWRPGEIEPAGGEDAVGVVGKPASPVSVAGANRRDRRGN